MPYRKIIFAENQVYHVYNRGVAAQPIFHSPKDYSRFLALVDYYRFANTPLSFSQFMKLPRDKKGKILGDLRKENNLHIDILTFCLMPNHFHFLLKQLKQDGISAFLSNLQNGYAKYINIKNSRVGPLFQSMFKAVMISTDEQLIHVSRYIHLNPATGYLVEPKNLGDYGWSSLGTFLKQGKIYTFVNTDFVSDFFKNTEAHHKFILDQASYQRELNNIKHLSLE